jgi:membrane protease YdiL (CAAX protease family)
MTMGYESEAERGYGASLTRKEQALELVVFLAFIVPSMILAYFISQQGGGSFTVLAVSTIVRDLALLALILFFLWRNGERDERVGWTATAWWREVAIGVALYPVLVIAVSFLEQILRALGLSARDPGRTLALPDTTGELVLAVILVAVVAVVEETIFRGYLILRLSAITRSLSTAVIFSAIIFALGHGYQGSLGVIIIGFMGVVFALIYLWRGSLVAPVTMHFLQNFIVLVLLPALGFR